MGWAQPEIFHAVETSTIETNGSINVVYLASAFPGARRFQAHRFEYVVDRVEIDCDRRTVRRLERRLHLTGTPATVSLPIETILPGEPDLAADESAPRRLSVTGIVCGGMGRYTVFPTVDQAILLWRTTNPGP